METKIIELSKFITGRGEVKEYDFTQIAKTETGYIYHVAFKGEQQVHHFEVFKRVSGPSFEDRGKEDFTPIEYYPKAASFGITAFTVHTLERANEILATFNKP